MKIALLLFLFFMISCQPQVVDDDTVSGDQLKDIKSKRAQVNQVTMEQDRLVIRGHNIDQIKSVKIEGEGTSEVLRRINRDVHTDKETHFISYGLMELALNKTLKLLITDALGQQFYNVMFDVQDGAVRSTKLHHMNATNGQILKFDGNLWVPGDLNDISYQGTWDANLNSPDLTGLSPASGEYYIITTGGTIDLGDGNGSRVWVEGDWALYNQASNAWDQIKNSSNVKSFNGRAGVIVPLSNDYTWSQVDKTSSDINDITNIDTAGASNGSILKFDGSKWVVGEDATATGGGTGTAEAGTVILNADSDSNSSGDISFQTRGAEKVRITNTGFVGIGTTTPTQMLDVDGIIASEGIKFIDKSEKSFAVDFTEGVSDEKVQIYIPSGRRLQGTYTVTVTVGYNYANCSGSISKRFHGYGRTNGNFSGKSIDVPFAAPLTRNCFTISDPQWDATNLRWYFAISSLNGRGNKVFITLEVLAGNFAGHADQAEMSALYSDDPTVFPKLTTHFQDNIGIGTSEPQTQLDIQSSLSGTTDPIEEPSIYSPNNCDLGTSTNDTNDCICPGGYSYVDSGTVGVFESNECIQNDHQLVLDEGKIGIGTSTPVWPIHIFDSSKGVLINPKVLNDYDTNPTSAVASGSMLSIVDSSGIAAVGKYIGVEISSVNNSGYNQSSYYGSVSVAGGRTPATVFGQRVGNSKVERMRIDQSGNVGIGTPTPSHKLHVMGTAGLSTGTAWTNTSDIRLKDIRGDYEYGLDEIRKLNTVKFNYKKDNELDLPSDKEIIGFIAQDVQQVIPEAVIEREDGFLELNVDPIHWAGINAIQDLDKNQQMFKLMQKGIETRVENLERKVASMEKDNIDLKKKNKELEERLERLENLINVN